MPWRNSPWFADGIGPARFVGYTHLGIEAPGFHDGISLRARSTARACRTADDRTLRHSPAPAEPGRGRSHPARDRFFARRRRGGGAGRPVRFRQVDDDDGAGRPGAAQRGPDRHCRAGPYRHERGRPRPVPARQYRHRVPELSSRADHDGARECRHAAGIRRARRCLRSGEGRAGPGRPRPPPDPLSGPAFRRRTAARRACPGLCRAAPPHSGRRADRQSGRRYGHGGHGPAVSPARRTGHDPAADHPRYGAGPALRQNRAHGRRPDRRSRDRLRGRSRAGAAAAAE